MLFIDNEIIKPLNDHLWGLASLEWYDWKQLERKADWCWANRHGQELHEAMQPYYRMYVMADERLFKDHRYDAVKFILSIIEQDDDFGVWMGTMDLPQVTECWIEAGNVYTFLTILNRLVATEYETDWQALHDELTEKLRMLEVFGESKSGEFYCILHGFMMIMVASLRYNQRQEMFEQFKANWGFLKHLYSVMVRRIIGFGFNNFVQVANNVKSPDNHPYLQLFYAALVERGDDLCPRKANRKKLEHQLADIEDIIHRTPQSHDLDRLCDILFPDEIRQMLDHHRHANWKEQHEEIHQLKVENQQLKEECSLLNDQMKMLAAESERIAREMAEKLRSAVESDAIPFQVIEKELLGLPPKDVSYVFQELNEMLGGNDVWHKHFNDLREKVRARASVSQKAQVDNRTINLYGDKTRYNENNA